MFVRAQGSVSSIASVAAKLEDAGRSRVAECTREMLTVIEHMQTMNRGLLNRLRPMALGHVPLENMLSELVQDRARQHPDITFSFSGDHLSNSYGDSVDLTIYRCTQESVTNAIKHANAKRIDVGLTEAAMTRRRLARPRQLNFSSAMTATASIRPNRSVSASSACRSACRRWAENIRSKARSAAALACGSRYRSRRPTQSDPRDGGLCRDQCPDHRRSSDRTAGMPAHSRRRGRRYGS